MAPKKSKAAAKSKAKEVEQQPEANAATNVDGETSAEDGPKQETAADESAQQDDKDVKNDVDTKDDTASNDVPEPKKRKGDESAQDDPTPSTKKNGTAKKQKTSAPSTSASRKSSRNDKKSLPTQTQLLNYLLSPASADLCRTDDELSALDQDPNLTTYSSSILSPFEELLCAVVLSRPISHRLGLRSIRTLLSPPYSFHTPGAIVDAGKEKVIEAMHDARTQHKDKTAEQISNIADVVIARFAADASDTSLGKLRESRDWDTERDLLQQSIKGLGKTGLDIFCRRTQWQFEEFFPFVDERTARGIEKLGLDLPKTAVELFKVLEGCWGELNTGDVAGEDENAKKRRAFVVICERATGADLEGRTDEVLKAAAAAS